MLRSACAPTLVGQPCHSLRGKTFKTSVWNTLPLAVRFGKPCSGDAWISNEVLEHVPAESLPALLADGFQILKPGGLAIHAIDYSDHFARGTDVSRYNFLQYSSARWRTFNSRIQFVNRLRHSEYLNLFRAAGFELVEVNEHSGEIPSEIVANLAPEFRRFMLSDLGVLRSRIVARRPL
jgi:SAM-dependent methyltransferase